jgi:hypothetical protein
MSHGQFHLQSRFANLHPGGINVLLDEEVAGQDATKVFFGLHRHEVLVKPAYARLQIGTIKDESESILAPQPGDLSKVPYAEPTWLTPGYYSPYFNEASIYTVSLDLILLTACWSMQSHKKLQVAMRAFTDEVIYPDAQACEENGKRISQSVLDAMA